MSKECTKRQKENYKGEEQVRCINGSAELFRQVVEDSQCAACPMKVFMRDRRSCAEKRKEARKPIARKNGSLVVFDEHNPHVSKAEEEVGYPGCHFRHKPDGKYRCSITNLPVDPKICKACDKTTREETAKIGTKLLHYAEAIRKWVASGRPKRTPEEIEQLFKDHCGNGCKRYDEKAKACKTCGCNVSDANASPLKNKLAMATEHCPLGRF